MNARKSPSRPRRDAPSAAGRFKVELWDFELDRRGATTLSQQVHARVRAMILSRALPRGACLPATRMLARQLRCGRNAVLKAYDQLSAEGYVVTRHGSGHFVSMQTPDEVLYAHRPGRRAHRPAATGVRLSKFGAMVSEMGRWSLSMAHTGFSEGTPDTSHFPFDIWSRIHNRIWRRPRPELLRNRDPAGFLPLREAIADYLWEARGMRCSAEQVMVTSGGGHALELLSRTLFDEGDQVWVENPGYPGWRSLTAAGVIAVPVAVDQDGLIVEQGRREALNARAAIVTPSHQFPMTYVMSSKRRAELLTWAAQRKALIIEDDYNCEIRFSGKPLSSLQAQDRAGNVIYVGTFSKVLFPELRLGYIVATPQLIEALRRARIFLDHYTGLVVQPVLAQFMKDGHFSAHVRKMRRIYADRQALMIAALKRHLGDQVTINPSLGGLHLVAVFSPELANRRTDMEVSRMGTVQGLNVRPLSRCYLAHPQQGLLLGYGALSDGEIDNAVLQLAQLLKR